MPPPITMNLDASLLVGIAGSDGAPAWARADGAVAPYSVNGRVNYMRPLSYQYMAPLPSQVALPARVTEASEVRQSFEIPSFASESRYIRKGDARIVHTVDSSSPQLRRTRSKSR